jgi:hypothetical protein
MPNGKVTTDDREEITYQQKYQEEHIDFDKSSHLIADSQVKGNDCHSLRIDYNLWWGNPSR